MTLLRHPCRRSQADMTVDRDEVSPPLTPFTEFDSRLGIFFLSPVMPSAGQGLTQTAGHIHHG
jgi:hypothetical protein